MTPVVACLLGASASVDEFNLCFFQVVVSSCAHTSGSPDHTYSVRQKATKMASFFEDLLQSIFTPGPTPSLLVATNVTFAALQVVLAAMLIATFSVHFMVLSGLCGGLWWSINWFAHELNVHRAHEEEKAGTGSRAANQVISSDESETEVEDSGSNKRPSKTPSQSVAVKSPSMDTQVQAMEQQQQQGGVKLRVTGESGSQKSSVSTEDEWEKISENENDK